MICIDLAGLIADNLTGPLSSRLIKYTRFRFSIGTVYIQSERLVLRLAVKDEWNRIQYASRSCASGRL